MSGMAAFNQFHGLEIEELNEFLREVLGLDGLENADQLEQPEVRAKFKIADIEQLNWAMRKMAALKASETETEALAKLELERIKKWKEKQLRGVGQSMAFFEHIIGQYMDEKRAANPKFKSESTPYGRVTFTKQQPEWNYHNEEAAALFLKETGLQEHIKEIVAIADKTKFKKAVEIKRNVFVESGREDNGTVDTIIEFATVNEDGSISGMDYAVATVDGVGVVVLKETGEVAEGITYRAAVAAIGVSVIPGIDVLDREDKIDVKAEA